MTSSGTLRTVSFKYDKYTSTLYQYKYFIIIIIKNQIDFKVTQCQGNHAIICINLRGSQELMIIPQQ